MGEASVQAAKWAREKGIPVVDDAGYFEETTEANTGLIDIFVGSRHYYNGLFKDEKTTKRTAKRWQKAVRKMVVFTLGAKGVVGIDGDKYFEIPAFKNITVVDTTGAGDVFHGAFIFGLLKCWDAEKAAKFSQCCFGDQMHQAGRASRPSRLQNRAKLYQNR